MGRLLLLKHQTPSSWEVLLVTGIKGWGLKGGLVASQGLAVVEGSFSLIQLPSPAILPWNRMDLLSLRDQAYWVLSANA